MRRLGRSGDGDDVCNVNVVGMNGRSGEDRREGGIGMGWGEVGTSC